MNGEIWVRHGLVGKLSILDGGRLRPFPEPKMSMDDWLAWRSQVWPDGSGGAVTSLNGAVLRHRGKGQEVDWEVLRAMQSGERLIESIPRPDGSILAVFDSHLELFKAGKSGWRRVREPHGTRIGPFKSAISGFSGEIWVLGHNGIGRFAPDGNWEERSSLSLGITDLDHPMPGPNGELLATGSLKDGRATLSWNSRGLELAVGQIRPDGYSWRGPEGAIWLYEERNLFLISGGRKVQLLKRGNLSSDLFGVVTEPNGGFWLATVDGLVHRMPGLWATPVGLDGVDELVHDVVEEKNGRLWFAATTAVLMKNEKQWHRFPLPKGILTHGLTSRALMPTAEGKLWVKCAARQGEELVLVLDPSSGRFESLKNPEGTEAKLFRDLNSGRYLLRRSPGFQVEIREGNQVQAVADLTAHWKGGTLKDAVQLPDGRIWLAGAGGGGVLQDGKYYEIAQTEYSWDTGFFSLLLDRDRVLVGGRRSLMEWRQGGLRLVKGGLDRVRSLAVDRKGTLWMATAAGVLRLSSGELITNGEEDGLASSMAHKVFEDSRGRIWAGTAQGISLYQGGLDRDPPVSDLVSGGNPGQASALGSIQLKLAGQDRWKQTESRELLYSWRLDEGSWTEFQQTEEARLEGLAGGRHKFEVRSMDRNGNVELKPQLHWFEVPVPWHRETGFLALAGSMLAALTTMMVLAWRSYRERGLMVEELSRARLEAEAASRQKSLFLANMSHEIRTPMNAILGMNQLALETPSGIEQREYLHLAHSSAGELLNLLNDILDLSKVEAGKLELNEENFAVKTCTAGVVKTLGLRAQEKGLALRAEFAAGLPDYVRGDEHRLRQVLFNLVGNALKFTDGVKSSFDCGLKGVNCGGRSETREWELTSSSKAKSFNHSYRRMLRLLASMEEQDWASPLAPSW